MGELPAEWRGGTVTEGNKNCYQERTFLDLREEGTCNAKQTAS
jgi:hypothetical protein